MAGLGIKLTLDAVQRRKIDSLDSEAKKEIFGAIRDWGDSVVAKIRETIWTKFRKIPIKRKPNDWSLLDLASSIRQDIRKGTGDNICTAYFRSRTDRGVWYGKFLEEGATFSIPDIYARMRIEGMRRDRSGRFAKKGNVIWTMHTRAHSVTVKPHPFMGPTIAASEADGLAAIQRVLDRMSNHA